DCIPSSGVPLNFRCGGFPGTIERCDLQSHLQPIRLTLCQLHRANTTSRYSPSFRYGGFPGTVWHVLVVVALRFVQALPHLRATTTLAARWLPVALAACLIAGAGEKCQLLKSTWVRLKQCGRWP